LSQTDTGNVANIGDDSGSAPSTVRNEEEKAWLSSALQSMSVDEAARMRELGKVLQVVDTCVIECLPADGAPLLTAPGVPSLESTLGELKLEALHELQDLVESIDNAKDLFMVGAVGPLLDCVRGLPPVRVEGEVGDPINSTSSGSGGVSVRVHGSTLPAVRAQACVVVGTVVQNNPAAQAWALGVGTLPLLLAALGVEGEEEPILNLKAAAAGALSSLLRDCKAAQRELLGTPGCPGMAPIWSPLGRGAGIRYFGGSGSAAEPTSPAAPTITTANCSGGRKLMRRLAALCRHLTGDGGCFPDAALAGLMASPTAPGAVPTLLGLLPTLALKHSLFEAQGLSSVLVEAGDVRLAVLGCVAALLSPSQPGSEGVEELVDSREPRGLYDGGAAPSGPSGEAPALLTDDSTSVNNGKGVCEGGGGAAEVPTVLSLSTRVAALRAAGAVAIVKRHAEWCEGENAAREWEEVLKEEGAECQRILSLIL